jgi:hemoglobin/transferrin/lactoferrin receptor protein
MCRRFGRGLLAAAAILVSGTGSGFTQEIVLDGVVVTSTKTSESAIDALSGSSAVSREVLDEQFQPSKISDVLETLPGITSQENGRDTAQSVNIRGLQDFGRVNVLIDGTRQNFQRSGHGADGVVYIEPEMLQGIDITRGPSATIYGSGAIGGVANFRTLDVEDILKPGEYAAGRTRVSYGSNGDSKLASETGAVKVGNFDILGQANGRWSDAYEDGDGKEVTNSGDETRSYLGKARWRPAEGHQITATIIDYHSEFVDQTDSVGLHSGLVSSFVERESVIDNTQYSLGYTFARPDTPLLDFSAKIYRNTTDLDQVRLTPGIPPINFPNNPCPSPANPCEQAGAQRNFHIETEGFDVFNTSRWSFSNVRTALTYGGDGFKDEVHTADALGGNGDNFTPTGERSVYGAFVQSQTTFYDTVDIIAALRYDGYELKGGANESDGERVSPKITAGVTPLKGITLFATYAEGYRAPAISEAFITGVHPPPAPAFSLLPNANLTPETAHNVEGGVNLKFDGVAVPSDKLRAKFVAFQNKIDDYIDGVIVPAGPPAFFAFQYQNIANATLEGLEFEGVYDAHAWFVGVNAARIRGTNDETDNPLLTIPADQVTVTVGFRALSDKLVVGARARFVAEQDRTPPIDTSTLDPRNPTVSRELLATDAYTVVDLFAQYEVSDQATLNLNIDNLFDENYRQYLDLVNSSGFSARVGLTMRLGAN